MSNVRKKLDGKQLSVFDAISSHKSTRRNIPGSARVVDQLRSAITEAIKNCSLSRHQIAGEMSHLLNEEITKAQLDSWTAESKLERHIPAEYIPAFCRATRDNSPLVVLIKEAGLFAFEGPEALRSEIHQFKEEAKRLQREAKNREQLLEILKTALPGTGGYGRKTSGAQNE